LTLIPERSARRWPQRIDATPSPAGANDYNKTLGPSGGDREVAMVACEGQPHAQDITHG